MAYAILNLIGQNSVEKRDYENIKGQMANSYQTIASCLNHYDDDIRRTILDPVRSTNDIKKIPDWLKKLVHPYQYFVDDQNDKSFDSHFNMLSLEINDTHRLDTRDSNFTIHTVLIYLNYVNQIWKISHNFL